MTKVTRTTRLISATVMTLIVLLVVFGIILFFAAAVAGWWKSCLTAIVLFIFAVFANLPDDAYEKRK